MNPVRTRAAQKGEQVALDRLYIEVTRPVDALPRIRPGEEVDIQVEA